MKERENYIKEIIEMLEQIKDDKVIEFIWELLIRIR